MAPQAAPGLCAFCRKWQVDPHWSPFCSERCKVQDLARWADESYRIPGESVPDSETTDKTQGTTLDKPTR